jgi:hypothetical protein
LAELERLTMRYHQQAEGSRQEALRRTQEVGSLREQLATLEQRLQGQNAAPRPPAAEAAITLAEATQKLIMDNDSSLMHAYEQQLKKASTGVTPAHLEAAIHSAQQRQQVQQQQTAITTQLQQAIAQRHPELLDMEQHGHFVQATTARYQELLRDPLAAITFPPNPAAMFIEPVTGAEYDMRVILQAAGEVKAQRAPGAAAAVPSLGVTPAAAPAPKGPAVPRVLVEGETALFRQPELVAALQQIGWGATPKEQLAKMLTMLPVETKARWARGQV